MKLFNTMTATAEEVKPKKDSEIKMYTCGPTVYDMAHIGNLRKYVCDDTLYRTLLANKFAVKWVMNITDVDDKTIRRSSGKKELFSTLTRKYEESFFDDLCKLNINKPAKIVRATEYIDKMVDFIEDLLKKGFAYKGADGSIYFSIAKFKEYGKLSKLENREIQVGARVSQDEYDKENPSDFALWKAWDKDDGEIYWETSLGKGRPGWHIECSAMSMDTLGETIDIHTGGVDNIFPHHENEIAQSEARTGKKFVNIWVHNEHLLVDGKKMSKSLGNFYRLDDIVKKGFSPLDFRYFVLGAHYRSKINFTWQALESAHNARVKLVNFVASVKETGRVSEEAYNSFMAKMSSDLDTPQALASMFEFLGDAKISDPAKKATLLEIDKILGLDLEKTGKSEKAPAEVLELVDRRQEVREKKDFSASDELRKKIADLGWQIEDKPDNQYELKRK